MVYASNYRLVITTMSEAKSSAHRCICFTWNNPAYMMTTDELGPLVKYMVASLECGNQGTDHYQGYAVFSRPVKYQQAARELGLPEGKVHFEPARGSPAQNRDYCTKDAYAITIEHGDIASVGQGKRTDIAAAAESAADLSMPLCDVYLQHPTVSMRYSKGIGVLRTAAMVQARRERQAIAERRQVTVHVYWGPPGAGKTTQALKVKDLYIVPCNEQDNKIWFDGYMGQKNILLEDFTPNSVGLKALLCILDGAPMDFAVKGGFVRAEWTGVYITSNYHPKNWYTQIAPESLQALARRTNTGGVIYFPPKPSRFGPVLVQNNDVQWNDMDAQFSDSDVEIIE